VADQYERPYLDSSVFLGWIKGEVVNGIDRGAIGAHILTMAGNGLYRIYTSAITLAEVHKLRSGPVLAEDLGTRILAYFEHDFIEIVAVDRRIGEQAHRFCREFGLLPNDAIHLASALSIPCDVLLAWDGRFAKANPAGIRIEEPQVIGQQTLPDMPSTMA
jgi:predicted nucleic acid-binding protein